MNRSFCTMEKSTFEVVVIGGGSGGIMVASQLRRKDSKVRIALIEPNERHYYQPSFTLVGGGTYNMDKTWRPQEKLIPKNVDWFQEKAVELNTEKNTVTLASGKALKYEVLIISTGLEYDMEGIPGLKEGMDSGSVVSNYVDPVKAFEALKGFKGGNYLSTQPSGAIKCGGAPQKAIYLAEHYLRKNGKRDGSNMIYATPGSCVIGVQPFRKRLEQLVEEKNILFKPFHTPEKIDAKDKTVTFRYSKAGEEGFSLNPSEEIGEKALSEEETVIPYDLLHIAPPQRPVALIRNSVLAHKDGPGKGYAQADQFTLQHPNYRNVFTVGDSAHLPTAKTGASIRKQAPVVVAHTLQFLKNGTITNEQYNGYGSCPIVTGYGRMLLVEFTYGNERATTPLLKALFNTTRESWFMWVLKKHGLPWLYWNMIVTGRM